MEMDTTYRTKAASSHQSREWEVEEAFSGDTGESWRDRTSTAASETMSRIQQLGKRMSGPANVGAGERLISLIAGSALIVQGLKRSTPAGWGLAGIGGALLYRGLSGYCPVKSAIGRNMAGTGRRENGVDIAHWVTVNKPRDQVYAFWRNFENLPRFMRHLDHVHQCEGNRSHWVARMPGNMGKLAWDAMLEDEQLNRRLAWRSEPGALVEHSGEVTFQDAPEGATRLHLHIRYYPPAGAAGAAVARILNPAFARLVESDIQGFKAFAENQGLEFGMDTAGRAH